MSRCRTLSASLVDSPCAAQPFPPSPTCRPEAGICVPLPRSAVCVLVCKCFQVFYFVSPSKYEFFKASAHSYIFIFLPHSEFTENTQNIELIGLSTQF